MKVLLFGGGAREHALACKIKSSPLLHELFLASPNDGFNHLGKEIEFSDLNDLAQKSVQFGIDLLIVGPEAPLMDGIVNIFKHKGIKAIGPDQKWAMLEGSKQFAKEFMVKHNIPTAKYRLINNLGEIKAVLSQFDLPVVLKADGLAAGKGVFITDNRQKAEVEAQKFLEGKFGEASRKIVVEEFLDGPEISLISLWDGKTLLPFITARDYKRLLDNNQGPNTGGMGSYCPVSINESETLELKNYIDNLEVALRNDNADFSGVIYSGLILTSDGVKVLEYNMRFGDPETQPLLMHLKTDLLDVFDKATKQELDKVMLDWNEGKSFCVVVAANGYPYNPIKGGTLSNVEEIKQKFDVEVFYAGVKRNNDKLIASGGRVLSICKSGYNPDNEVYQAVRELEYFDKCFRNDIGANL